MARLKFRFGLTCLTVLFTVLAMTAQGLAWAAHTHTSHLTASKRTIDRAALADAPLTCRSLVSAAGIAACATDRQTNDGSHNSHHDKTCALCWSHVVSAAALTPPPLAGIAIPAPVSEPHPALTEAGVAIATPNAYCSRGPPAAPVI